MLSSWQAWNLCIELNRPIPPRFKDFAIYFGRDDCIGNLLETQAIINHQLKDCAGSQVFEKAGKTFEEIAQRSCDLLDHTLHMADTNQVPVCTCGRKGHLPQQCTFKSHI